MNNWNVLHHCLKYYGRFDCFLIQTAHLFWVRLFMFIPVQIRYTSSKLVFSSHVRKQLPLYSSAVNPLEGFNLVLLFCFIFWRKSGQKENIIPNLSKQLHFFNEILKCFGYCLWSDKLWVIFCKLWTCMASCISWSCRNEFCSDLLMLVC